MIRRFGGKPISEERPALLTFSIMNGSTGTGFKPRLSNNFIVTGVINRIVVTLSKNTEMLALMIQRIPIKRQMRP